MTRTVILTGASRSGSTFFGDLMSHAGNAVARHEAIGGRQGRDFFCVSSYAPDHAYVRRAIAEGLRGLHAAAEAERRPLAVDVNSNVAFAVEQLRGAEPGIAVFHLVRDGRKVVASNWPRKMYTDYAKGIDVRPTDPAEYEAFEGYDRFGKLCWQWNRIATELLSKDVPTVRMEAALADYAYLDEAFLKPSGVALSEAVWEARRAERKNESRFKLGNLLRGRPTELEWSDAQERTFQAICGETMRRLGYG